MFSAWYFFKASVLSWREGEPFERLSIFFLHVVPQYRQERPAKSLIVTHRTCGVSAIEPYYSLNMPLLLPHTRV